MSVTPVDSVDPFCYVRVVRRRLLGLADETPYKSTCAHCNGEGRFEEPETDKPGVREAGWRPIETAPKDGVDVILGTGPQMYQGRSVPARVTVGHWTTEEECRIDIGDCGGDCLCREYEYADPSWISWDGGFTEENPATHWMPLPEAPDRALSVSPLTEEQPAEGWKLVPVEPTEAMIASAVASYHLPPGDVAVATEHVAKVFRAMLAAAPLPRSTTGGAK